MSTGKKLFKPGQSGNPKGRPPGSRNKLQEDFLKDCYETWKTHGKASLVATAEDKPADFVKVIASLMPKDVNLSGEIKHTWLDVLKQISDERITDSTGQRPALEGESQSVRH